MERWPGTRATQYVPRSIKSFRICYHLPKPEKAPWKQVCHRTREDPEGTNTRNFTWMPLFFTDSSGQLRRYCEQGHRLVAQTLWDPGPLSLTACDVMDGLQALPEHPVHVVTNCIEMVISLWCSKCSLHPHSVK